MRSLRIFLFISFFQTSFCARSQDTFSILGIDSLTGEVGAAGASCIDMFMWFPTTPNDFITDLFPNQGAIACQASYDSVNQNRAKKRFNLGDTPAQIIAYLQANDVNNQPQYRQYGVVKLVNGSPQSAGFTGINCLDYKNHISGPNYSIQGNILLGKKVLDSMEVRFNREKGSLACKLMAAMQGAKMVGADSRCAAQGVSSMFAFLKVAQPVDGYGSPSLLISLRTHTNSGIEPIDSLQKMFNAVKSCTVNSSGLASAGSADRALQVFPNPALNKLTLRETGLTGATKCQVWDVVGKKVYEIDFEHEHIINLAEWCRGVYFVELRAGGQFVRQKIILD